MDIDLELYKTFYYVCEFKNITKVAEILCVTQPAISKQINKLEEAVNKKLILRTNRGIELTSEGQIIYGKIKEPIEALMSVEEECKEQKDSYDADIRIISGRTYARVCIMDTIVKFNKMHPKVRFRILTVDDMTAIKMLRSGDTDIIFYNADEVDEIYPELEMKEYMKLHDIFVVHKDIKNQFPSKIKLKDLNDYNVMATNPSYISRKCINDYFESIGQTFKPKFEVHNDLLMFEYIKNKMGMGVVIEEFVKDQLESGEFVKIETDKPLWARQINIAMRKSDQYNKVIMDFVRELKKSKK